MKFMRFLIKVYITPLIIAISIFVAYQLGMLINQTTFIIVLVSSGIMGQVIQFSMESRQKKKEEEANELREKQEEKHADPLSKLPIEVQELIAEAESLELDEGESKQYDKTP